MPLVSNPHPIPRHVRDAAESVQLEAQVRLKQIAADLDPITWEEMSAPKKAEWRAYRAALRGIQNQPGLPDEVSWPQKPE